MASTDWSRGPNLGGVALTSRLGGGRFAATDHCVAVVRMCPACRESFVMTPTVRACPACGTYSAPSPTGQAPTIVLGLD